MKNRKKKKCLLKYICTTVQLLIYTSIYIYIYTYIYIYIYIYIYVVYIYIYIYIWVINVQLKSILLFHKIFDMVNMFSTECSVL